MADLKSTLLEQFEKLDELQQEIDGDFDKI